MRANAKRCRRFAMAAAIGGGVLLSSGEGGFFVSRAEAWIGRPLTPMSYAGVARRTTRRAYGVGAVGVYGAPVYGAPVLYGSPVYAPSCYQVVGPYGGIVTRCP
jgi:hypothetical protein